MTSISIDGQNYDLTTFSEETQRVVASIQFIDRELVRHETQIAVLKTARALYSKSLKEEIDSLSPSEDGAIDITGLGDNISSD